VTSDVPALGDDEPIVSIVMPAYRAEATIGACLRSLLDQQTSIAYEVIVVLSADSYGALPDVVSDPRVVVEHRVPRLAAAPARNLGATIARGRALVFTDADVLAPVDWLARLVAASDQLTQCVAGGVRNGTPRSVVGTAEYLVAFLDLHPNRPARTAWHGATCNLLVPRELWERFGPFPEDLEGGEDTLLTGAARRAGRFCFSGPAWVEHVNRTSVRAVVRHQREYGRFTAHLGRRAPYKLRPLVRYTLLAPLAAAARVVSVYSRAFRWLDGPRLRAFAATPVVLAAVAAWGAGLAAEGARLDLARRRQRSRPASTASD
jgi:glycosyltransferase involved in cell wall biosynthesis